MILTNIFDTTIHPNRNQSIINTYLNLRTRVVADQYILLLIRIKKQIRSIYQITRVVTFIENYLSQLLFYIPITTLGIKSLS